MSDPLPSPRPRHGDVVVKRELHPEIHFTVGRYGDPAQFVSAVRADAVLMAERFAMKEGVDAWYGEGDRFRLLNSNRSSPAADETRSVPHRAG